MWKFVVVSGLIVLSSSLQSAPLPGGHSKMQSIVIKNDPPPFTLDLSPGIPHDIDLEKNGTPRPVEINRRNVNIYAWNTFFAANWPALAIDTGRRGIPDPNKKFGTPGPVVWNTFKEKRELFRVIPNSASSTKYSFNSADPGTFDSLPFSPSLSTTINACQGETPVNPKTVYNYLDESQEIGLATIWLKDPIPTDDNLVRTQVKMNRAYYDYVRDNKLYSTDVLNKAVTSQIDQNNPFGPVTLPVGDHSSEGAILIKTSWIKASQIPTALQGKYFKVKAVYYVDALNTPENICYRSDEFALIAIHIIHKTAHFPQFLYTTFENKNNFQLKFVYANALGGASTLPNGFGHPYQNPPNPLEGLQNPPYPVQALHQIHPTTQKVNQEAQNLMAQQSPGSVWLDYQLVGVQYAPTDTPYAQDNQEQDYYLANPFVETNQRFQFFTGSFLESFTTNLLPHPYRYTQRVQMGGCMGCHGAGAQGGAATTPEIYQGKGGTDFSFILNNVRSVPTDSQVETLKYPALQQITTGESKFPWLEK